MNWLSVRGVLFVAAAAMFAYSARRLVIGRGPAEKTKADRMQDFMRDHREADGEEKSATLENHVGNCLYGTIPDRAVAANDQSQRHRQEAERDQMRLEVTHGASRW